MLRIVFAGTPEFAVPTLQAVADSHHVLAGVLTQPDRPAGRGRALRESPVKRLARQLELPLSQPAALSDPQALAALAAWTPDVLVVVAYGLILPAAVLSLPRFGCVNIHASLLPRWRGAAPIQRALLAGDVETGVTVMRIEAALDTGPVLAQQRIPIDPDATSGQLHDRLSQLGAALLVATLEPLQAGLLVATQQSNQGVTYAAKIAKSEALVGWGHAAAHIGRQIRAFNPWPVAETLWQAQQLRIWEARVLEESAAATAAAASADRPPPGTILGLGQGGLLVQCGQGLLVLTKLQLAGRRAVTAREFAGASAAAVVAGSHFG